MFLAVGQYGTLPSTKTMGNISEHAVAHSISTSPSHGNLALYSSFSPPHQQAAPNPSSSLSEVSSPVLRGDGTLDHWQRSHLSKVSTWPSHVKHIFWSIGHCYIIFTHCCPQHGVCLWHVIFLPNVVDLRSDCFYPNNLQFLQPPEKFVWTIVMDEFGWETGVGRIYTWVHLYSLWILWTDGLL